ncbi:MAG: hypothetical protein KAI81_02165 [Candidatus Marinimicrobia bacterium]|nr:hypothetical protein [Candidatus Neomarinimicrobiota bacterium]
MKRKGFGKIGRITFFIMMMVLSSQVMANYKFYNMVKHVCKVYQIDVSLSDMTIHEEYDGKLYFDLKLDAGRNNFDTVLMVGFIGIGKALEKNPELELEGVNVTLGISSYENTLIIASASANDIVRFVRGDISSNEFKNKYITII